VLVAYGQNGEMLRPENGYPLRLVVPGVQGVSWVKYLRRVEVGDQPYAAKDEAIHYIDLMPNGLHRQYTSIQECKSVITTPSGGQVLLDQGFYNITGLAWSGRGKIKRVDVSVDGGRNWRTARLETPVLSKALTRFNIDWIWQGKPAILQSRAIDESGYVQTDLPATARSPWHAIHLSQQRHSVVVDSGERRGEKCSTLVSPGCGCCRWRHVCVCRRRLGLRPIRALHKTVFPVPDAMPRRVKSLPGTSMYVRTSKACPPGKGRWRKGRTCGRPSAHIATAFLASPTRCSVRSSAEPPPRM